MFSSRRLGWIGIDVGAHTVKVAQLERRGGVVRLGNAAIARRDDVWESSLDADAPARSSFREINIAQGLAGGFNTKHAAAVLSMRLYDHRGMRVENADEPSREQVANELESVLVANAKPRIFDVWSTETSDTHRNAENVNLLSVTEEWAEQVCDDLQHAGFYTETLDGPPHALARSLEIAGDISDGAPSLVIDWGFNRITVSLVQRDRPLFVRCLRECGYRTVLDAVARALGVNRDEAQKVLSEFGLPENDVRSDDLQHVLADITVDALSAVADELERTLAYVRMNRRSTAPVRSWLFGGGATMKNADRFIEQAIGMRTQVWTLDGETEFRNPTGVVPIAMLGPAIALSALAWSA